MRKSTGLSGLTVILAAAALPSPGWAGCRVESGPGTAALVELYTSEGCSSCPPADRWLSALPTNETAAGHVVPIALHITYWDDLGWRDPFAREEFTARQRSWQALNHGSYVYTPQIVLSGRDYPGWSDRNAFWRDVKDINGIPARAGIALDAHGGSAQSVEVTVAVSVPDPRDRAHAALFIAATQSGLSSRITAGENGGSTLKHDHVAGTWLGPVALGPGERSTIRRTLANPVQRGGSVPGIVAFVEDVDNGRILQAVAGEHCD